jgi:Fe-S-cluster-containing dehydrogenase component
MKGVVPTGNPPLPNRRLSANQRVVIKSQGRQDTGPFVRYSCWHCVNPPCATRCPFKAIKKDSVSGAVWIDPTLCNPASPKCARQCKSDCQKGGVPMIGSGSDLFHTEKAWKCTMCRGGYAGAPYAGAGWNGDLPTKAPGSDGARVSALQGATDHTVTDELDHQPSCVYTCPAKAMVYDTKQNIDAYVHDPDNGFISHFGDDSMWWASRKGLVAAPKADPFMEDHAVPMIGSLLSSPFAKAALAPTLVAGALLALSARRAKIEEEALSASGEVR